MGLAEILADVYHDAYGREQKWDCSKLSNRIIRMNKVENFANTSLPVCKHLTL